VVAPGHIEPLTISAKGPDATKLTVVDIRGLIGPRDVLVSSDVRQIKFPIEYKAHIVAAVLGIALSLALVVGGVAGHALWLKSRLRKDIGSPSLDISKSWASNITVGGALLTAVLSGVLPETTIYMAKAVYQALSLFFSILVVVAPMLFLCVQRFSVKADKITARGHVWIYLLCNTVTVSAVAGQMLTLVLALDEVRGEDLAFLRVVEGVLLLLIVLELRYSYETILVTVEAATNRVPRMIRLETGLMPRDSSDTRSVLKLHIPEAAVGADDALHVRVQRSRRPDEGAGDDMVDPEPGRWNPL
jgi:hypothetical protein